MAAPVAVPVLRRWSVALIGLVPSPVALLLARKARF
jgi:hypothetical protein